MNPKQLFSHAKPNNKPKLTRLSLAIRASVVGIGMAHGVAQAETIEVTSNLDIDGDDEICTLREAIVSANTSTEQQNGCKMGSDSGTDTITFSNSLVPPNNTITLANSALVLVDKDIDINASSISGGITVDGNLTVRIFDITSATLTTDNITISGGSTSGGGGGIYAYSSNLSLYNSTVSGNSASSAGAGIRVTASNLSLNNGTVSANSTNTSGGAIWVSGSSVSLINSTVSGNSATNSGGGMYIRNYSTVDLNNSTISSNLVGGDGGGIIANNSSINLSNSTLSNNLASNGGGILAGFGSVFSLSNSIIANSLGGGDCLDNYSTTITPDSVTIIEDNSCNAMLNGDPGLLPLADNGGMTLTHALTSSSIARNIGICDDQTPRDQRGQLRDEGDGLCDVGAVEYNHNEEGSSFYVVPIASDKTVVIPL